MSLDPNRPPVPYVSGPRWDGQGPTSYHTPVSHYGQPQAIDWQLTPADLIEDPTDPPHKSRLILWVVGALALALVAVGIVGAHYILPDSGIKACKAMAGQGGVVKGDGTDIFTDSEYHQLRGAFEGSRFEDIKTAGVALTDMLRNVMPILAKVDAAKANGDDMASLELLPYVGTMQSTMQGMQTACANHGVTLPVTNAN